MIRLANRLGAFACAVAIAGGAQAQVTGATPAGWSGPTLALRSDFNNLAVVPDPRCQSTSNSADTALPVCELGAVASLKIDQLTKTESAVVDGVGLASINYKAATPSAIQDAVLAAYVQSEGTNQFATGSTRSKASDTITPGLLADFSATSPFTGHADDMRLRVGEAFSSSGTQDFVTVAEWQPALSFRQQLTVARFGIVPIPELMVQYDRLTSGPSTYQIFSKHLDDLRIGPQLTLLVWDNASFPPTQPSWVRNFGFSITGHVSEDVLSSRTYAYGQATLSYKITKVFGLAVSYGYGDSDVTGNLQQQIKVGLSVKWSAGS